MLVHESDVNRNEFSDRFFKPVIVGISNYRYEFVPGLIPSVFGTVTGANIVKPWIKILLHFEKINNWFSSLEFDNRMIKPGEFLLFTCCRPDEYAKKENLRK